MSGEGETSINGTAYDHSSCRFRIDGQIENRIDDCSYSHGVDGMAKIYGKSTTPIGRTRGQYKPGDPSITFHRAAWNKLRKRFGNGFLEREFPVIIEYDEAGEGFVKDIWQKAKIKNVEHGTSQGGGHAVTKVNFDVMMVIEDGVLPMANQKVV